MNNVLVYWVVGCLLVGAGAAKKEVRCPREKPEAADELLITVAIWPASFAWALMRSEPPPCRDDRP